MHDALLVLQENDPYLKNTARIPVKLRSPKLNSLIRASLVQLWLPKFPLSEVLSTLEPKAWNKCCGYLTTVGGGFVVVHRAQTTKMPLIACYGHERSQQCFRDR